MKIEIKRDKRFIPFQYTLTFETEEQVRSFLTGIKESKESVYDLKEPLFESYHKVRNEFVEQGFTLDESNPEPITDAIKEVPEIQVHPKKPKRTVIRKNNSDEEME